MGIGVHLDPAEVRPHPALHERAGGLGQGRPARAGRAKTFLKIQPGIKCGAGSLRHRGGLQVIHRDRGG